MKQYLIALIGAGILLLSSFVSSVWAEQTPTWLTKDVIETLFPGTIHTGPIEGDPPAVAVYGPGAQLGYVFATSDIVDTVGFSGAPFTLVVGLDIDGVLTGTQLLAHAEPIIDYNMLSDQLGPFTQQYPGLDYAKSLYVSGGGEHGDIDGITSATISARAFHQAIIQSARLVTQTRGLRAGSASSSAVDTLNFQPATWAELLQSGAIVRLQVTGTDLGDHPLTRSLQNDTEPLIDLYMALLNPTSVGRNLLNRWWHSRYVAIHNPEDLVVLLMANGSYSFVGTQVFYTGIFDRIRIVQDDNDFPLLRKLKRYRYLPFITSAGAPKFNEIGLFKLPVESGIEVLKPWNLALTVRDDAAPTAAKTGTGTGIGTGAEFRLQYQLPEQFVLPPVQTALPDEVPTAAWKAIWRTQMVNIAILVIALVALTVILLKMQLLTQRPRLYQAVRIGFLLFTLIWLGWVVGAQLSVINPLTWLRAFTDNLGWDVLLLDPLLCVLAIFVLISFFIWGRGVFCGWLCPFGALQELLAKIADWLRVPQLRLSHAVHRLLWPVKYVVLTGLVVVSFYSATLFGLAAEVEPFKTVITLRFERAWSFVSYALALLIIGLFVERAFCRFLCPLGAVMALGGKLRIFGTLKRRQQCGSPCQLCARRCPIQAIAPSGQINMDECFYCLDCQVIYHDVKLCPPLVANARRAAKSAALA